MGDKFKAVFKVFDAKGNVVSFEEAHSEFGAIFNATKRGLDARTAEIFRIINL